MYGLSGFFMLVLWGCSSKSGIYQTGREWNFCAYFYDANHVLTDSFPVKMKTTAFNWVCMFMPEQKGLHYYYEGSEEPTGYIEDETRIFLHPPRGGKFAFTEIVPMPEISFPLTSSVQSDVKLEVIRYANMEELSGQTILQKQERTPNTEEYEYQGKNITCYKVEGWNTSHVETLGQYRVTYWFCPQLGFVRFLYTKPDHSVVDIRLGSTNF
jgi:hypothetical protein